MDNSTCSDILELKLRLKEWEHNFQQVNGRVPGKGDIKRNKPISELYHEYNSKKKKRVIEPLRENDCNTVLPRTPQKSERKRRKNIDLTATDECTSRGNDDHQSQQENKKSSPIITSMGPTPQKCGSILGIFDIIHIDTTPVKEPRQQQVSVQDEEDEIVVAPESPNRAMLDASSFPDEKQKQQQQQPIIIPINPETPKYLQKKKIISCSPSSSSPLRPRKPVTRSLSDMIAELQECKESDFDEQGEFFVDTFEDEMEDEDQGLASKSKDKNEPTRRSRKIKRKTKMHIFRDVGHGTSTETRKDDDIFIQQQDDEDHHTSMTKTAVITTKMINPNALSHQNFRRLKIQKGKQKFNRRRR